MHPTIIRIDRQQFIANLTAIRQQIGPYRKLCLPVKANGYGHGILEISSIAAELVDYLAVACLAEGVSLREHGITTPILVFGSFDEEQLPGFIQYQLEFTVASLFKAQQVEEYCRQHNCTARVHLGIDTGMNRVGIRSSNARELIDFTLASKHIETIGIYSHLASSDEPDNPHNQEQLSQFSQVASYAKQQKPELICHLANSGGVCYFPESYFDMVRPGIMSYGYISSDHPLPTGLKVIKPCFSLISKVAYFKVVEANQGLSYNHRYKTSCMTRVVTLPIGYGDGYRRGLSNIGQVLIGGRKYTISGTICMDMLLVDIGPEGEAYVGDEVVLIGHQAGEEIKIVELARQLNTIVYEILVGFNQRILRVIV